MSYPKIELVMIFLTFIRYFLFLCKSSQRCRFTLRGHTDSVNSIEFVPFSNILLTSSSDKTISMWDARTVSIFISLLRGRGKILTLIKKETTFF